MIKRDSRSLAASCAAWDGVQPMPSASATPCNIRSSRSILPPRYRGRIVLTRDPDGEERCVACNLCAVACPVGCISLQKPKPKTAAGIRSSFRINFSRCIFCGMCEEACPTTAIQLTPDFEMAEYNRQDLVYEKEDLLISGPGKIPGLQLLPHGRHGHCRQTQRAAPERSQADHVKSCCWP
jgi:NADH-quinone oxidoreductase subunit I